MKRNSVPLLRLLAAACLLAAWPRPAAAYIDIRPPTLGALCQQATHIHVLRVEKLSPENGVILFKTTAQLKTDEASAERLRQKGVLPQDGALTRLIIRSDVSEARAILDWAAEGKTAVLFVKDWDIKSHAHLCIDGSWYLVS